MIDLRKLALLAGACALVLLASPGEAATPSVTASANSCALDVAGTVYCWGSNRYGALGQGQSTPAVQSTPVAVQAMSSGVSSLATGGSHTCAIDNAGGVKCWGNNSHGQLGTGSLTDSSTPVQVAGLTSGARALFLSTYYSCALLDSGAVTCWGGGGQLGGPVNFTNVPRAVTGLPSGVKSIAAGLSHACALTTQGAVWCWGSNFAGQLGNGSASMTPAPNPAQVAGLASGIASIASSKDHTCAVTTGGAVSCWGGNVAGTLGNGTTANSATPVPVTGLGSGIASVAAGYDHTCALTQAGSVLCWGSNQFRQLGNGSTSPSLTPVAITGLGPGIVSLSTQGFHTCALLNDGGALCWGFNNSGQAGNGTTAFGAAPQRVVGLSGARAVATGASHTCALTVANAIWCWGDSSDGALGTATLQNVATPLSVIGLPADLRSIGTGGPHTCALRNGGEVLCWGAGYFGQSGENAMAFTPPFGAATPVTVPGLPAALSLSVGSIHNCIVSVSSEAWCWGNNSEGQLGIGSSGNANYSATPVRVNGLGAVRAVGAGLAHSCAIDSSGGVSCWGYNGWGQLGNGTRTDSTVPVAVTGLSSGAAALALGWYRTCALTNTGAVLCWGQSESTTPTPVAGLASGVTAISVGGQHACALKAGGEIVCWGSNTYGQLGDGTTARRDTPVPVVSLATGASAIAAGTNHTCAVAFGGIVGCWGGNENGELGDGTFAVRSRPAVVLRRNGDGSIVTGDWYLDLNPGVGKVIPGDRIPAFLAVATGSASSNVTAQVRFRSQDVGKRIRVFAYAPAALVRGALAAKDGETCVLAQLTPTGLLQTSASGLGTYASDVQSSQPAPREPTR